MKTEADLQERCISFAEGKGCICGKVEMVSRPGWPDLLVLFPDGHIMFVELKHPNGKGRTSAIQDDTIEEIQLRNGEVHVTHSLTEFENLVFSGLRRSAAERNHSDLRA